MPPKKKARGRHAAADDDSPPVPEPVIFDGWTDEQETTLFKAISVYRLKPAGMHKHFRIIGIAELMKNHGVSDTHTNIDGIWRKLRSQYNLEGLDEREDLEDDPDSPDPPREFVLPLDEFGGLMVSRRSDPNSADSPFMIGAQTQTQWPAVRGKKAGRAARSVSATSGPGTGRTESANPDETEDDSMRSSTSPAPTKAGKPPANTNTSSTSTTTTTASRRKPPGRKKGPVPKAKPGRKRKPVARASSTEEEESDASDDELSDVPDEMDEEEGAAETEAGGSDEPEPAPSSEAGESSTAAGTPPPPMPKKRGRKPGPRKVVPPKPQREDVRRSTRRK